MGAWVTQQARNLRLVLGERGGRGHLAQVLGIYVEHDNGHRPHRAPGLESPDAPTGPVVISDNQRRMLRRDRLSGLLHECHRQAA
jgi:hypothetical protein